MTEDRGATWIIEQWGRFFTDPQQQESIYKYVNKGRPWVKLQFLDIAKFNQELADMLLDTPEEVVKGAEMALAKIDHGSEVPLVPRIFGLPKSQQRHVWQIRTEDVGVFIGVKGIINKSSGVVHVCSCARYECIRCGAILNVLMESNGRFKVPRACGCGSKTGFRLLDTEVEDSIKMGIADDLMDNDNRDRAIAREKMVVMMRDLTCFAIDKLIKPGKKVIVNGYLKYLKDEKTNVMDSEFVANSIEFVEVGWQTIRILPGTEERILEVAKSPTLLRDMSESIADIEGHPEAKLACLLQLAGAPNLYDSTQNIASRGTIHLLLVGEPGVAKTYLAKRAGGICPIYSFQSAVTSSGRGLVASVAQDKVMGCWVIYPGVVAMASKGVVVIDEVEKTHEDDYGDHNNAMNDMRVFVAKANVKGVLETETSYLATANPKHKIFSNYESFYSQIEMPKDFLDRFDLILPIVPAKTKEQRDKVMDIMLQRHSKHTKSEWTPKYDHAFMREYIAYGRQKFPTPALAPHLFTFIKEELHNLMKPKQEEQVRVSFRQLESILRFAYASARLHLRDITEEDVKIAFDLKKESFRSLGIIDEQGGFSWVALEDIKPDDITRSAKLMDIIREEMPLKGPPTDIEKILDACVKQGLDRFKSEVEIDKLRSQGVFFEPRRGQIMWT